MPPTAYPTGWFSPSNLNEDKDLVRDAFELLKLTYPPGQYGHLHARRLRRKMVCRENSAGDLVLGLRIFWRPDTSGADRNMAAFFFVRLRQIEEYALTIAVGSAVTVRTITDEIQAICGYMRNQPGGARRIILSVTNPPVTLMPNLTTAFNNAITNGDLVYEKYIPRDLPPWPEGYHVWRIEP